MLDEQEQMTVVVQDRTFIKEGEGKGGAMWTLWKVAATEADGTPILEDMITFDALPLNQPIEVSVERREREGYDPSLKLSMPRAPSMAERVDDLEKRLGVLEARR